MPENEEASRNTDPFEDREEEKYGAAKYDPASPSAVQKAGFRQEHIINIWYLVLALFCFLLAFLTAYLNVADGRVELKLAEFGELRGGLATVFAFAGIACLIFGRQQTEHK